MLYHPTVALSAIRSGGLYLSPEFLADNGFVVDFEEYFFNHSGWEGLIVPHLFQTNIKNNEKKHQYKWI
jgi:hypothetical protein